jgi:hypothetical protein
MTSKIRNLKLERQDLLYTSCLDRVKHYRGALAGDPPYSLLIGLSSMDSWLYVGFVGFCFCWGVFGGRVGHSKSRLTISFNITSSKS